LFSQEIKDSRKQIHITQGGAIGVEKEEKGEKNSEFHERQRNEKNEVCFLAGKKGNREVANGSKTTRGVASAYKVIRGEVERRESSIGVAPSLENRGREKEKELKGRGEKLAARKRL